MAQTRSQLSALSRLFSSTVVRELAVKGKSPTFGRVMRQAGELLNDKTLSFVSDAFDAAFNVLKAEGARDEYIYRAALTHNILLGKHNLRTACMLTEFRAGECKADVAILNGKMTVYEIKSERDSLARLERQLANYRKVFASVYVIASETHVDAILEAIPADVGLLALNRRFNITALRKAEDAPTRICPLTSFDALRTAEAGDVLRYLGRSVPDLPNTRMRAALREQFATLWPEDVHEAMLHTLKRTRNLLPLAGLIKNLPTSMHAAALSIPLRKSDHDRLVSSVYTPIEQAKAWA